MTRFSYLRSQTRCLLSSFFAGSGSIAVDTSEILDLMWVIQISLRDIHPIMLHFSMQFRLQNRIPFIKLHLLFIFSFPNLLQWFILPNCPCLFFLTNLLLFIPLLDILMLPLLHFLQLYRLLYSFLVLFSVAFFTNIQQIALFVNRVFLVSTHILTYTFELRLNQLPPPPKNLSP